MADIGNVIRHGCRTVGGAIPRKFAASDPLAPRRVAVAMLDELDRA